ncbi:thymus-specific serine protease [Oncorhynchus tshawytscha]|uniref:thymus-specific serine protease n=1 Tax=Oncorhynchus tshawytscha TaxID=74940 RepID=UPI000D0A3811|nr:thymus-specific serine protease [Oncorhynchus tshawytscha]
MAFQALIVFTLACLCVPCYSNRKFIEIDTFSNDVQKGNGKPVFQEQWITQKLDHFNGADSRVWNQKFLVTETYYRAGGPVFLMIGGEGPINAGWMAMNPGSAWLTYAKKLGALCLMVEHRFYGDSRPTVDLSTENLRFLSSQQALADLAHFRTVIAKQRGLTNSKWVAFGGSYPGALAAWSRLKYPHLIHAAVASSAPLHATVNFSEYLEVVWRALAAENPECPLLVKKAFDTLQERIKDPNNYDNITKDFNLCSKLQIQSEKDRAYILDALADNIMNTVQYNNDNREFEHVLDTNCTIKTVCGVMSDASLGDPYYRFAAFVRLRTITHLLKPCVKDLTYNANLQDLRNTSYSGPHGGGGRQWTYQTCTEFGYFQTTDSPNQPFGGFGLQYHVEQCQDIFNISAKTLYAGIDQTNENYGSYNIRATRIVFPNGSIDPWHALGITSSISDDLPAIFIKGTAHCANMYPARAEDLPQLTLAREHVFQLLQKWLKEK